ncbi:hypothetical protein BDV33DRAFT_203645 [Aspergillus novoparasiticus]|uniref:Uncharacterized protein n=1 Tax=Aspergillus novoparasiticus TaxID=986946 RepID=A0A5N6EUJ2_9EURO|nr:hypothetical protein BDV33DRAFT_203645 [Aspergillus novoparasiticus]
MKPQDVISGLWVHNRRNNSLPYRLKARSGKSAKGKVGNNCCTEWNPKKYSDTLRGGGVGESDGAARTKDDPDEEDSKRWKKYHLQE